MKRVGNLVVILAIGVLTSCAQAGTDPGPEPEPDEVADPFPAAGNPGATYPIPAEGVERDTSTPDRTVGSGTPASCTDTALASAIAEGGVIVFDCGSDPVTISVTTPIPVYNDAVSPIVLDGGGTVTLSGGGANRILYMNTCDSSLVWTTAECQNQDHPDVTIQNLTFVDGDSSGDGTNVGGGAIWTRGGRFRIINSRFFRNTAGAEGDAVSGGAVYATDQFNDEPVLVVASTFGGAADLGNSASNGGALGSRQHSSWTIINSILSFNEATGNGGVPADPMTPGGGTGGAIFNDGDTMTLSVLGSRIEDNHAPYHGSAIRFLSQDESGTIVIDDSYLGGNTGGTWYRMPGVSTEPNVDITVTDSTVE